MENIHVSEYYKRNLGGKEIVIKPQKSWEFIKEKNNGREELIAFSEDKRKVTYGEMFIRWDETAKVLSACDIWRGNNSRILCLMPNLTQTGIITYGSDMTGSVIDFIDPTSSYDKIRKYVEQEKITDIISLDLLLAKNVGNKLEELKKDFNIKNVIVYHDAYMQSLLPFPIKLYSNFLDLKNAFGKQVIRYEDAVKNSIYTQIKKDTMGGDALSFITHTSGTTTGIGKPVPLTDHNRNSLVHEYELAGFNWKPGMKMLHFIPYFAGYGTVNTTHLGLSQGVELQEIPLFTPTKFSDYVANYKSNVVVATTPCWLNLVNNPKYKNIDLSFLQVAATGGSPTSKDDESKINNFFESHGAKCRLMVGYGMSELAGCAITDIDEFNKLGSTGVPLPGVDLKLKDEITGEFVDYTVPNSRGEAYIHSETMTSGVLDGKKIIDTVEIDGKNYIKTKDIMESDKYGHISYIGRMDGMFQRYDGYNVYPLYIEEMLKTYEQIKDCCLVWEYIDELNGKIPKLFIELEDNNDIGDKTDFINRIVNDSFLSNKHKSNYVANFRDLPHIWNFIDNIPKNTMGKTDLHRLMTEKLENETYILNVEEDNMSVKSFSIDSLKKNEKVIK